MERNSTFILSVGLLSGTIRNVYVNRHAYAYVITAGNLFGLVKQVDVLELHLYVQVSLQIQVTYATKLSCVSTRMHSLIV